MSMSSTTTAKLYRGDRSDRRITKSLMSSPWKLMRPWTASSQAISPGGTRRRIVPSSTYAFPSARSLSAISWWRPMRAPWKIGCSSQSSPSHLRPSRITWVCSSVERALSVSSMRSRKVPPLFRAYSQLKSAVRAPPTWRYPVGEGAKRTRTVMGNGGGGIRTPDRVLKPYNGLANRRLQPLGHPSKQCGLNLAASMLLWYPPSMQPLDAPSRPPAVPWAVALLIVWSAVEATLCTFGLRPTMSEVLSDLTGFNVNPIVLFVLLLIFLTIMIAGSFACIQVLNDAIKAKHIGNIVNMFLVQITFAIFQVLFLYRPLVDALTPWLAQQGMAFGSVAANGLPILAWVAVRGMTWYLFGRFGAPALLAVLNRPAGT